MKLFGQSLRCCWLLLTTILSAMFFSGCDCGSTQKQILPPLVEKVAIPGVSEPQPSEQAASASSQLIVEKSTGTSQPTDTANQPAAPQTADGAALPFSIELQTPFTFDKVPALHSYSAAQADVDGVKWLLIGGRIGGLHSFDAPTPPDPTNSFPRDTANDRAWVIDIARKQVWSMPLTELIPAETIDKFQLRASNAISCQVGDRLYIMGGYGFSPKAETAKKTQTFGTLTAIQVSAVIKAVKAQQPVVAADVTQIEDPKFKITGGELLPFYGSRPPKPSDSAARKADASANGTAPAASSLQLCAIFGQVFDGLYSVQPAATGGLFQQSYTEQIAIFNITETPTLDLISCDTFPNFGALKPPQFDGYKFPDFLQIQPYHRRDLNVLPAISPDGKPRIGVYGGVFRPGSFEGYVEPIYIDGIKEYPNDIQGAQWPYTTFFPGTDHSFQQLLNQYKCAALPVYSTANNQMTTIFFGGISNYRYDATNNQLLKDPIKIAPNGRPIVDGVPFAQEVTSIVVRKDGSSVGYVLPISMPGFLGAGADLLIDPSIPQTQGGVIQFDQITEPKTIGYIYGGIQAFGPYTAQFELEARKADPNKPVTSSLAYNQFIPVVIKPGNWPVKAMPAKPSENPKP